MARGSSEIDDAYVTMFDREQPLALEPPQRLINVLALDAGEITDGPDKDGLADAGNLLRSCRKTRPCPIVAEPQLEGACAAE